MTEKIEILSDYEHQTELIKELEEGEKISHYQLYKDGTPYYNYASRVDGTKRIGVQDYNDFGEKHIFTSGNNILISLGCGNSEVESSFYSDGRNNNMDYVGVDSSQSMLNFSEKQFENYPNTNTKLVKIDFMDKNFHYIMNGITQSYDKKIFAFFGATFGNIPYRTIMNTLYNMLEKGEQVWISIGLRQGTTLHDDNAYCEKYHQSLSDKFGIGGLVFNVLEKHGISLQDGKLGIKFEENDEINSVSFKFIFQFKRKIKIIINNTHIQFQPNQEIELYTIQRYTPEGLIELFESYGFKFIEKQTKELSGQFLFEKI
ncbi:L-histidine N(alpha)-methyltransferase [Candidatus Gracilibacteria bacterium]|nr:L-histidine N(alpha)-methyltransferase [Candidatus Gracilibacteria bacterium]